MDFWLGGHPGADGVLSWTASTTAIVAIGVIAALAWIVALRTGRAATSRLRWAELMLWALSLTGLAAALSGPVWVEEEGRRERARLVVLVDTSASMAVLEGGAPRGEEVDDLIGRLGPDVDVFTFDEELRVSNLDLAHPERAFDGRGTDLGVALSALSERFLGQSVRGVVLMTDGLDRGALRRGWKAGEPLTLPDLP